MNNSQKKQKTIKPPALLRGLFSSILLVLALILASSWSIISFQVEQLVAERTSEYAHNIANIAAGTSAESLLSDDKLQLKILVENVAKDPYIKSATVFAEDGQIAVQSPEVNLNSELDPEARTHSYIQSESDLPFIEKIIYQDITAGWFKIVIDRQKLENSFRQSLGESKRIILLIAIFMMLLLFAVILQFSRKVKNLVSLNHRIIQINALNMPKTKGEWMETIQQISETQFYNLAEFEPTVLDSNDRIWFESKVIGPTTFCVCQFAMQEQDNELSAQCLTQAENYLQSAIHAHGLHSQGNILSGCLIPFFKPSNRIDTLEEAVALIHLIKELLASLTLPITMRAFIGTGNILTLENNRAEISGISLSNRKLDKINQLSAVLPFESVTCFNFERDEIAHLGEFASNIDQLKFPYFQMLSINHAIQQQVNRQVRHFKDNNSAD